jgi:hypothetical protein
MFMVEVGPEVVAFFFVCVYRVDNRDTLRIPWLAEFH